MTTTLKELDEVLARGHGFEYRDFALKYQKQIRAALELQARVDAGWVLVPFEDVSLAAQMLTWGKEEGLTEIQERDVDAHTSKLFAMLSAPPRPHKENKMVSKVYITCFAYEQGMGSGLKRNGVSNPYLEHASDEHEAWAIGYSEGVERAIEHEKSADAVDAVGGG